MLIYTAYMKLLFSSPKIPLKIHVGYLNLNLLNMEHITNITNSLGEMILNVYVINVYIFIINLWVMKGCCESKQHHNVCKLTNKSKTFN